jgi:ribosomal protein L28
MSRIDQLSGKRANVANSRSHSNIATKRKQNVNLQTIRIGGKRIRVSTRTVRSLKRAAAIAHGEIPTRKQKKAAKKATFAANKK